MWYMITFKIGKPVTALMDGDLNDRFIMAAVFDESTGETCNTWFATDNILSAAQCDTPKPSTNIVIYVYYDGTGKRVCWSKIRIEPAYVANFFTGVIRCNPYQKYDVNGMFTLPNVPEITL